MASSTRSRLFVLILALLGVGVGREILIRRHEGDLDDWPRRTD